MKRGDSIIENLLQRERLLALCSAQRDELAALTQRLDGPIKVADRGIAGVHYLREHPLLLGALVAVGTVTLRRGLWKWAQRGFVAWRTYRAFAKSAGKAFF